VPRIADFCICIYVFGCRLSIFRLCDRDFGITRVDVITVRITLLLLLLAAAVAVVVVVVVVNG
jgi:hypothetical protein